MKRNLDVMLSPHENMMMTCLKTKKTLINNKN